MKKLIFVTVVIAGLIGLFWFLSRSPGVSGSPENEAQIIFYWGESCPHCENVKNYITTNSVDSKIKITYKEVYYHQQNKKDLETIARQCQLDTSQGIGVPLAFFKTTSQCLVGDQPIISQIKQMLE